MKKLKFFAFALVTLALLAVAGCSDQWSARVSGGNLEYKLPPDAQLINMTWKVTGLWVLYYRPATKDCVFAESSVIGTMNGTVTIPNCNPIALAKTL